MKKAFYLVILAAGIILLGKAAAASALGAALPKTEGQAGKPIISPLPQEAKVVLVIVDRLTLQDLDHNQAVLPNFRQLTARGAVGLLNSNTGGNNLNPENTYATIGAGSHIMAAGTAALGLNAGEKFADGRPAADEYKSRTGRAAPAGAVVQLGIARLQNQNATLPYPAAPGALGTTLHAAGLKTAVFGNADTAAGRRRQAVTVAMDETGLVDHGNVGTAILRKTGEFPGGLQTSYPKLLQELANLPEKVSLTVIEVGDLSRLEELKEDALEEVLAGARKRALQEIDFFLGQVIKGLDLEKDLLLVVAPTRSVLPANAGNYLPPVLIAGAGVTKGFLSSPSTKRPGLVLNTDLAPTILRFFNLPIPGQMVGQPALALPGDNQLATLAAMQKQLALTYTSRPPLQKGYILFQLGLLGAGLYCIFRRRSQAVYILQPFLLAVMAVPLAYLLLPFLPQPSFPVLTGELLLLTAGLTFLALVFERRFYLGSFIFLSLVTTGLLMMDTLTGAPLQKTSLLGYDPIVGARFYGMGNEYMGILIGSLVIGWTAVLDVLPRYRRAGLLLSGLFFCLAIFLLGNPALGTNMGGVIAASVALFTTFLLLWGVRFNFQTIFFLAVVVACLVLIIFFLDLCRAPEARSHFGRNAAVVLSGGWPEIKDIIRRKTEMNIKLFRYTIWSRIFIASLGSLALLFYRPVGVMARIKNNYPNLYKGLLGVVTGSIAALIFNDSGIVAAATTMVFGVPLLIFLVLKEQS